MKKQIPKVYRQWCILTVWLMRNYEADFGQTLKECSILQITQLLKIQRTKKKSKFCWAKTSVIFKNKLAKQNLEKLTDEEKLH